MSRQVAGYITRHLRVCRHAPGVKKPTGRMALFAERAAELSGGHSANQSVDQSVDQSVERASPRQSGESEHHGSLAVERPSAGPGPITVTSPIELASVEPIANPTIADPTIANPDGSMVAAPAVSALAEEEEEDWQFNTELGE